MSDVWRGDAARLEAGTMVVLAPDYDAVLAHDKAVTAQCNSLDKQLTDEMQRCNAAEVRIRELQGELYSLLQDDGKVDRALESAQARIRELEGDVAAANKGHDAAHAACVEYEARIRKLEAERDALIADVREWACEKCNFVYPGPPQPGVRCVVCPRCGGSTMPHATLRRRKAEAERDALRAALLIAYDAVRAPLDEWKGCLDRKACDAIRAALPPAPEAT